MCGPQQQCVCVCVCVCVWQTNPHTLWWHNLKTHCFILLTVKQTHSFILSHKKLCSYHWFEALKCKAQLDIIDTHSLLPSCVGTQPHLKHTTTTTTPAFQPLTNQPLDKVVPLSSFPHPTHNHLNPSHITGTHHWNTGDCKHGHMQHCTVTPTQGSIRHLHHSLKHYILSSLN